MDLTVPGVELVAIRDAGLNHGHEDVYVALRDELAERGIDPARVRFVHQARNDAERGEHLDRVGVPRQAEGVRPDRHPGDEVAEHRRQLEEAAHHGAEHRGDRRLAIDGRAVRDPLDVAFAEEGSAAERTYAFERKVDARFAGQAFALTVPLPDGNRDADRPSGPEPAPPLEDHATALAVRQAPADPPAELVARLEPHLPLRWQDDMPVVSRPLDTAASLDLLGPCRGPGSPEPPTPRAPPRPTRPISRPAGRVSSHKKIRAPNRRLSRSMSGI